MNTNVQFAGLVLAAGKGTRFQAETGEPFPKVLRPVLGKPMVCYVLDALRNAGIDEIVLVVGYRAQDVMDALGDSVRYVMQEEQKGSGHAVACAKDAFAGFDGHIIVMCGDSPMFSEGTIRALMIMHEMSESFITLAVAELENPHGYGRILRDKTRRIEAIVEEKCATDEQRSIREVNGGAYVFDAKWLFDNIDEMRLNEAGEYNLTDMVRVAIEQKRKISTVKVNQCELLGVNNPEQLRVVEDILRSK